MAQKMVDLKLAEYTLHRQQKKLEKLNNFLKSKNSNSLLLSNNKAFFLPLSKTKHATIFYSKSYRDFVLAFNINSTKSFIITKEMWKIFHEKINIIDKELNKSSSNGVKKHSSKK
jgi:hypothetical protein